MSDKHVKHAVLRPSAARLLESMRDIGYSFESALADIVDNSISAGASRIDIVNDVSPVLGPYLAILDDGRGMSSEELTAAMQHGSRSPRELREDGDLGRFGLGLKTASFSQSRRLTVVSAKDGLISGRRWDLDKIIEADEWLLEILDEDEVSMLPLVDRLGSNGTIVLWQKLDRLDTDGDNPADAFAALNQLFGSAKPHLELTFHRFIAPEPGDSTRKVTICINGAPLRALDPLARLMRPQSESHQPEPIAMEKGTVLVQGFTLPHHQRLSREQLEHLELGGSMVERQGLYVYRANRLIIGGTWLGLARQSELTKLLRVRVDVPTSLDSEWSIDVRKSRIRLPSIVRSRLRPLVERMTEEARRPYTYRGRKQTTGKGLPLWSRVTERGCVRYVIDRSHPLVLAAQQRGLLSNDLEPLLLAIESTIPIDGIFSDFGDSPQSVRQEVLDEDALERLVAGFIEAVAPNSDYISESLAEKILSTHIFQSNSKARDVLNKLRKIVSDK